jgi:hypothetical protein
VLTAIPSNATTVTNYYKQNVYNPSESKIGEIVDVLVSNRGTVDAFIVSVGGFLGIDSKDVAIPFTAIHATEKNGKWWLTMNATKEAIKAVAEGCCACAAPLRAVAIAAARVARTTPASPSCSLTCRVLRTCSPSICMLSLSRTQPPG